MSDEYDQEAVDSAIILENKIKERVTAIVKDEVTRIAGKLVRESYVEYKNQMMMEVAIKVGQILRNVEMEGRKPLWETDLKELGFKQFEAPFGAKEEDHAVHQDPPPL